MNFTCFVFIVFSIGVFCFTYDQNELVNKKVGDKKWDCFGGLFGAN